MSISKTKAKPKLWILLASVITLAAVLSGCGGKGEGAAAEADAGSGEAQVYKLKIADILSNPVFRVAEAKGIFDKYGIDAEIVTFATPAEGINSLFIKQVDIAWGADFPVLKPQAKATIRSWHPRGNRRMKARRRGSCLRRTKSSPPRI